MNCKAKEIKILYRARKEFCDEFGKWPMMYSVRYFLTKLAEIDKALFELGEPAHEINYRGIEEHLPYVFTNCSHCGERVYLLKERMDALRTGKTTFYCSHGHGMSYK